MKEFKESPNTAVFTTRFVVEKESTIVYVSHDEDGSWQFHGFEDNVADEDIRLVALDEIVEIDASVLELAEMPKGQEAIRKDKNSDWQIINNN